MTARKHPGNPAKMTESNLPRRNVDQGAVREFEEQCRQGLICGYCTDQAVATKVATELYPVFQGGVWSRKRVHMPVCGPGFCENGYDK